MAAFVTWYKPFLHLVPSSFAINPIASSRIDFHCKTYRFQDSLSLEQALTRCQRGPDILCYRWFNYFLKYRPYSGDSNNRLMSYTQVIEPDLKGRYSRFYVKCKRYRHYEPMGSIKVFGKPYFAVSFVFQCAVYREQALRVRHGILVSLRFCVSITLDPAQTWEKTKYSCLYSAFASSRPKFHWNQKPQMQLSVLDSSGPV